MVTVGYICLRWGTYGYINLYMVTVRYIWMQRVKYGTSGYIWLQWVTHGYIWLHMVIFSNGGLNMVTSCYRWL